MEWLCNERNDMLRNDELLFCDRLHPYFYFAYYMRCKFIYEKLFLHKDSQEKWAQVLTTCVLGSAGGVVRSCHGIFTSCGGIKDNSIWIRLSSGLWPGNIFCMSVSPNEWPSVWVARRAMLFWASFGRPTQCAFQWLYCCSNTAKFIYEWYLREMEPRSVARVPVVQTWVNSMPQVFILTHLRLGKDFAR